MKKVLGLLLVLVLSFVDATSYYVSNSGNDSLDGKSDATAWRTIGKVNLFNFAVGDDVYFKRGNEWENEQLYIHWSGNAINRVFIGSYGDGNKPIINGNYIVPDSVSDPSKRYVGLIQVKSQAYITIENLRVINSRGIGIRFHDGATYGEVKNVEVSHSANAGIQFNGDTTRNGLIENCVVSFAGTKHQLGLGTKEFLDWPLAVGATYADNVTVRNCKIFNTYTEGIGFYKGSDNCTAENNIVYNTCSASIYIDSGQNNIVRNNLVYCTPDSIYRKRSIHAIKITDENLTSARSKNNDVYGNFVAGCDSGFGIGGVSDSLFLNSHVYNNIFVGNNISIQKSGRVTFSNSTIQNNIFWQAGGNSLYNFENKLTTPGIFWNYNLWSSPVMDGITGENDAIGIPKLIKNINWRNLTEEVLSFEDFKLQFTSPTINNGTNLGLKYSVDYFGNTRGADGEWDIGAIEFGGAVVPPVISENCNNSIDDDLDGLIDCLDSNCPACVPIVDVVDVNDIFVKIVEWKTGQISLDDVFVVIRAWGKSE